MDRLTKTDATGNLPRAGGQIGGPSYRTRGRLRKQKG